MSAINTQPGAAVPHKVFFGRMSEEHIVGIDLGTTNSLVAYMQGETPVVIPGEDGASLVPSVVALTEAANGERMIVGNRARTHLIETPDRAIYSVKRLMGRGIEDVRDLLLTKIS